MESRYANRWTTEDWCWCMSKACVCVCGGVAAADPPSAVLDELKVDVTVWGHQSVGWTSFIVLPPEWVFEMFLCFSTRVNHQYGSLVVS